VGTMNKNRIQTPKIEIEHRMRGTALSSKNPPYPPVVMAAMIPADFHLTEARPEMVPNRPFPGDPHR